MPLMYLVDTPGVLPPKLGDVEMGMKLALCGKMHSGPELALATGQSSATVCSQRLRALCLA